MARQPLPTTEHYAARSEILRYLEFVTDRMDLRRDIQFNATVTAAAHDADRNLWEITLANGATSSARFMIAAVGCLSAANTPAFPGSARSRASGTTPAPGRAPGR